MAVPQAPFDLKIKIINQRLHKEYGQPLTSEEEILARELLGNGLSIEDVIEKIVMRRDQAKPRNGPQLN